MKALVCRLVRSLLASKGAHAITEGQGIALAERVAHASLRAPKRVMDMAEMLTAQANLLEAKATSEKVAPPAYRAHDEDGEEIGEGWPFSNAPVWATGTSYYMQALRLHLKTVTGRDYSQVRNPYNLARMAREHAVNLIVSSIH